MWIYLNDRFVKDSEATVSVFDHGFLYGDGVYETIRSYGKRSSCGINTWLASIGRRKQSV